MVDILGRQKVVEIYFLHYGGSARSFRPLACMGLYLCGRKVTEEVCNLTPIGNRR